jgi:dihydrofolate reductase
MNPRRIIGVDGKLPWHYPEDLRRFKRLTLGGTIIMGRRTWESLPKRPLAGRRNLVLSSRPMDDADSFPTLAAALAAATDPVWYIGGARLFQEALAVAAHIDLTYVPDAVEGTCYAYFPELDGAWAPGPLVAEGRLRQQSFTHL